MNRFSPLVLVIALVACKSKEEGGGGAASGKATEAKGAALKLEALGLQVDVPGEVTVGKEPIGDGVMVSGSDLGAMTVEVMKKAQTVDEAKSDASMYSPKNVKPETLTDGWALTYDNTGGAGSNYFVQVRRDLGGKSYLCSTTAGEADQAKAVLAACKSLRK